MLNYIQKTLHFCCWILLLFASPIRADIDLLFLQMNEDLIMRINGPITKNQYHEIAQILDSQNFQKLIILLDSQGGDGHAAIEIGRLLRQNHAHIFVENKCASACIFVLMGGVIRGAKSASVGIHAPRITISSSSGEILKEVDEKSKQFFLNMLKEFDQEAEKYLKEMNIPVEFYQKTLNYSPNKIRWLTDIETDDLKITGFDETLINVNNAKSLNRKILQTAQNCRRYYDNLFEYYGCYEKNIK